jgi:hypothetical protein
MTEIYDIFAPFIARAVKPSHPLVEEKLKSMCGDVIKSLKVLEKGDKVLILVPFTQHATAT